jgi:bifunctional DNA-binding transcriptional regulator/antitoxin component of YhaV-PrlF toxin-antitoxin module
MRIVIPQIIREALNIQPEQRLQIFTVIIALSL